MISESFLTRLQNTADTRQQGIRKEDRIVAVADLRLILEHFTRLDNVNRTDYHEAKHLRQRLTIAQEEINKNAEYGTKLQQEIATERNLRGQAEELAAKQAKIVLAARAMYCDDGKVMGACGSVCSDRQIEVCKLINALEEEYE